MSDEDQKADEPQAADSNDESSTLEADLQTKMDVVMHGESEDGAEGASEGDKGTGEGAEGASEGDKGTGEGVEGASEGDKGTGEGADDGKKDDAPLLPSGHRRAALARGFTTEEVDHYLETKPEEAKAHFAEVFDKWQTENSEWSDRGRQLLAAKKLSDNDGDKVDNKVASEVLPHYDADALIEKHGGNDELIHALVDPLNTMVDRLNTTAEKLSESENFVRGTEERALQDATQEFFESADMKSYRDTYGFGIPELTKEQEAKRMELFEQADIIVAGARDHGKDITVRDALERAHIILSVGTRDEAIRQGIRESLKKRTKTAKSSHKKTSAPDTDQPISDEELEKRTDARLKALRNKT